MVRSRKTIVRLSVVALIVLVAPAAGWALAPLPAGAGTTAGATGWVQANDSGFGIPENYHVSALAVLDDTMYAGTWNDGGAQVWRTADGRTWSEDTPPWAAGNAEVECAAAFGSYLYVGTGNLGGGELWRTDGAAWEQVAAAGLGDPYNYSVSALAEFDGNLYLASGNWPPAIGGGGDGVEIWRSSSGDAGTWDQVNDDGFDQGPTWMDETMEVYAGRLYVGLGRVVGADGSLAELWSSADGTTWTPVFTDGLGDAGNGFVASMAEFRGSLVIGLRNNTTGGQVWRWDGGPDWTALISDGLGDPDKQRPYGLIEYDGQLVLVFGKWSTGAEVYQSADGLAWQQIAAGGWGDGNNQMAAYFDKAIVLYRGSLYIGTLNTEDGGEIWRRQRMVYLPLVARQ